ncbi:etoposide-induced protein 2.4 homolog [Haliotis rufescens]|uniref:etoposide-induced protein 2.4 homolog n=1 Tax=Haliotis rufescens TaxID=6454 RepID=UPI001EAFF424|nr:etoposide-induced protein 2.4 homolog [Haliotis rufescens]
MTDTIKSVAASLVLGFRDAVLGTRRVLNLDADLQEEEAEKKSNEPLTTLARRRLEKNKHKDVVKEHVPRVTNRIFMCCAWNGGVCWLSIFVFHYMLLPCIYWFTELISGGSLTHGLVWSWLSPLLSWTFSALWVLPLFVLSKVINCFWFQDIADAAYLKMRGKPKSLTLSTFIADMLFSVTLQAFFLIQATMASSLPIYGVGQLVSVLHFCLLYSLYTFEYKWYNMGLEVHTRLSLIEINWPYFVGFGLPMALATSLSSSTVISGCIFSILFPLFIISANDAQEPAQPFEFPLKLFTPVRVITNAVFHRSMTNKTRNPSGNQATPKRTPTRDAKQSR